nr:hypothetical protein Q903MT_gene1924 [Picea sitchensis]
MNLLLVLYRRLYMMLLPLLLELLLLALLLSGLRGEQTREPFTLRGGLRDEPTGHLRGNGGNEDVGIELIERRMHRIIMASAYFPYESRLN